MAGNGKSNGETYMRVSGGYLEVRMKLDPPRRSASGKSDVVASTSGAKLIPGTEIKLNLTAYQPPRSRSN